VRIFRNKWLILLLASCGFLLQAQVHKVGMEKTITFEVGGATAAYSLNSAVAEASAEHGLVTIVGMMPGSTRAVVITPMGPETFDVVVPMPPPIYPPGFVMPISAAELAETGSWEGRYYSSPAEVQNQFDFTKTYGEDWTHVHVVETNLLGLLDPGESRVALSSATYEIVTPNRDITLFDKYLDESLLTINGSIVRGFHMTDDNWFVHAGYTSVATFEGLFLPTLPEMVVGGGYNYPLTENSSITGSFYHFQIPALDLLGRSGYVGDVRYKYSPRRNFWFTLDAGVSRGVAGAGRLLYKTQRDSVTALARYMPAPFASLGANNLRGVHTDFSWTRHVTPKFDTGVTFYNNNVELPGLRETTITAAVNLRYQLSQHWSVNGGALATRFQNTVPLTTAIRSFSLPAGLAFQARHFGASGLYQFAPTSGHDSGAQQFRASAQTGWGGFTVTAYAERDTNAPTLSFIFSQVAGLQQALNLQGIQATTVQQVDQLLSDDAYLIAAGYIKGVSINVVPVRTQLGGTATWATRGMHRMQLSYTFLYNDNQLLLGATENIAHTISYSQNLTRSDILSLACSVVGNKNPGEVPDYTPICFIAWKHQFQHVPDFIIPERHGTISGRIFQDDRSTGEWQPGLRPMAGVEVMLDETRRALTQADGSYRFPRVPRGKHKVAAMFHSQEPFFFTTASDQEVDEEATVNFGIGFSLSGMTGEVLNDAGQGVGGVAVAITSQGQKWSAVTEWDGSFFVPSLAAGDYSVQADENSLPAGYSTDGFGEPQSVTVGATSPGRAHFTMRAFRSISGRVLTYNTAASQYIPVVRAQVSLREPGLTTVTDPLGRYLFRDLAAGSYTISVQSDIPIAPRTIRLGAQPVDLANVDFQIGPSSLPAAPAPVPAPPKPQPPGTIAVRPNLVRLDPPLAHPDVPAPALITTKSLESGFAAAQRHNVLGRQLTQAGRYREAVAELTEALRIAPGFALAFNARGFARLMLHDWTGAIEDLSQAILLNPGYGDAYKIRAIAKRAIGDKAGADADAEKSRQPAR
jgi:hypothetical protein